MAFRNGFTPARQINPAYVTNLPVSAGSLPVMIGDAVTRVGGKITSMPAGQDPASPYGVVMAIYTTANRPLTHQAAKCIVSGQVGRADVNWDPNQTYFVRCATSIGVADIQARVFIDATATNTRLPTGVSTQGVVVESSASVGNPFKIIGLAPMEELSGKHGGAIGGQMVEVAWNNHWVRTGA